MRDAKDHWVCEQCMEIEDGMRRVNSKQTFDSLKMLTKSHQTRSSVIEDDNAKLLTFSSNEEIYNTEMKNTF